MLSNMYFICSYLHCRLLFYFFLHIDDQQGGGNIPKLHSPDKVTNPIQATTWKYVFNDKWIESDDILVGPGM